MKEIDRQDFSDIHLVAGDSLTFNVKLDGEVKFTRTLHASKYSRINQAAIFELENELGFKDGHALVAGEKDA